MKAVLIPGDGIGREIAESVRAVSTALNTGIEWQEFAAGAEYAAESGELIAPAEGPHRDPHWQGLPQHQRPAAPALFHLRKPAPCAHAAGCTYPL